MKKHVFKMHEPSTFRYNYDTNKFVYICNRNDKIDNKTKAVYLSTAVPECTFQKSKILKLVKINYIYSNKI
jgi:hypothetical protein